MTLLAAVIFLSTILTICKADFHLEFQHNVLGTWKGTVTVPCSFSTVDYTLNTVTWLYKGQTIILRDGSQDSIFLNKYRGRLSLPIDRQGGDVSLTIKNVETDDKGEYTCKASLTAKGTSIAINKEAVIFLDVKKVAVTKPVIQPEGSSLEVSEQATVTLTCSAEGSPPVTYRWYKRVQEGKDQLLTSQNGNLMIQKAQTSDSGAYYCEAENRISETRTQKSKVLQLTVTDDTVAPTTNKQATTSLNLRISTTEGMESKGTTRGHEHNHTKEPSSAKGDTAAPTANNEATTTEHLSMSSTKGMGSRERSGTTEEHEPNRNQALPTTKGFNTTTPVNAFDKNKGGPTSSGMNFYVIILIVVTSLALLCALVALVACQRRRRKTSADFALIQTMSVLNAQANQPSPAVNVCHINVCQINNSQPEACQSNGMAAPRSQNDYELPPTQDQKTDSVYQDVLTKQENEYELLLTEKKKQW